MGVIPLPVFKLNLGVGGERGACVRAFEWRKQILRLNNFTSSCDGCDTDISFSSLQTWNFLPPGH